MLTHEVTLTPATTHRMYTKEVGKMASDLLENLHPKGSLLGKCFVEVRAGPPRAKAGFYSEGIPIYPFKTAIEHQKLFRNIGT